MTAPANNAKVSMWSNLKDLFVAAGTKWSDDNVSRLSAAFAFYAILSLAPVLVFIIAVASLIYGRRADALDALVAEAQGSFGKQGGQLVAQMVQSSVATSFGTLAAIFSVVVTFFSASNLFLQLDDAMKTIWGTKGAGSIVRNIIVSRVIAFVCVLIFGVFVMAWIGFDSWMTWAKNQAGSPQGFQLVSLLGAVVFLTFVFAPAFKFLPGKAIEWKDVWPGAFIAGCGVGIAKLLLSIYFVSANVSAAYGSAGALVVILLWLYYTAQIFFFGVEFTYVQAQRRVAPPVVP